MGIAFRAVGSWQLLKELWHCGWEIPPIIAISSLVGVNDFGFAVAMAAMEIGEDTPMLLPHQSMGRRIEQPCLRKKK